MDTKTYNMHQAKKEIIRRKNKLDKIEDEFFEQRGYGFEMHDKFHRVLVKLNILKRGVDEYLGNSTCSFSSEQIDLGLTDKLNAVDYGIDLL